ncbi:MAG: prepilin-type N-terminal cleavage/methylation domain-containing protein [Verrucomicrobiales bacterium]
MHIPSNFRQNTGLTLLELLIVIAIIGILAAILVPATGKVQEIATVTKDTQHLKQIAMATTIWAAENGGRLPSPEYPGGMEVPPGKDADEVFPDFWDFAGTGLWLDGVVFGKIYLEAYRKVLDENGKPTGEVYRDTDGEEANMDNYGRGGGHLEGTVFVNTHSAKQDPTNRDWHKHSYAMNANLQYDRIYDTVKSSEPYLTEKTLSNLLFAPNALLYIECTEPNVIMFEDRDAVIETIETRWGEGGRIIAVYLDGHADRLTERDIPDGDPETARESSRFWRGVDSDR